MRSVQHTSYLPAGTTVARNAADVRLVRALTLHAGSSGFSWTGNGTRSSSGSTSEFRFADADCSELRRSRRARGVSSRQPWRKAHGWLRDGWEVVQLVAAVVYGEVAFGSPPGGCTPSQRRVGGLRRR